MNPAPIISVTNVWKSFSYWEDRPDSLKDFFIKTLTGHFRAGEYKTVSVLENVSFEIYPGDFVGIMGRNGVGKSSLLKILSGIYQPNQGNVHIRGNIAPLLELGAGFSPELSGIENIYLNASILGYGQKSIDAVIDQIIEFSELGDKIHLPVKNYSSGMVVRLGFSIAVHFEASILLFDEVLAVGDIEFQKKSLNKIKELHKQGRSIVLVTHNPEQITNYCNRCIVFENKKKIYDGTPEKGVELYIEKLLPA